MHKFFGSVLLIVGTTIGAAMLALPTATAYAGFWQTIPLYVLVWLTMTYTALLILEINLWFPEGASLSTMAKQTLGWPGYVLMGISFTLLLYTLMCAYVSACSDAISSIFNQVGVAILPYWSVLFVVGVFGAIVYKGVAMADWANRLLIFLKILLFMTLLWMLLPHVAVHRLSFGAFESLAPAVMLVITSFGYAIIIPSLRRYLNSDVVMLKRAILIGSLAPLIGYLLWVGVVQGAVPLMGEHGLLEAHKSQTPSTLVNALIHVSGHPMLAVVAKLFVFVCITTSMLGVSMAFADFVTDGLGLSRDSYGRMARMLITFLPPIVVVITTPNVFIIGLAYAGMNCVIVLMLLPILMAWVGRYWQQHQGAYTVGGGRATLVGLLLLIVMMMIFAAKWF